MLTCTSAFFTSQLLKALVSPLKIKSIWTPACYRQTGSHVEHFSRALKVMAWAASAAISCTVRSLLQPREEARTGALSPEGIPLVPRTGHTTNGLTPGCLSQVFGSSCYPLGGCPSMCSHGWGPVQQRGRRGSALHCNEKRAQVYPTNLPEAWSECPGTLLIPRALLSWS